MTNERIDPTLMPVDLSASCGAAKVVPFYFIGLMQFVRALSLTHCQVAMLDISNNFYDFEPNLHPTLYISSIKGLLQTKGD